jgi:acylphosphatase
VSPAPAIARAVRAHGLVQGVGYRWSCVRQAQALGLAGWVRNRSDGTVEAWLQGPATQVDAMCEWMRTEVPGARVDRLEAEPANPDPGLPGFEQRPTL